MIGTNKRILGLTTAMGLVLAACGASTTPPYSLSTNPTLWITYPTEGTNRICVTNNRITVNFYMWNVESVPGAQVRFTLDRHADSPNHVGKVLGTTATTPTTFDISGGPLPVIGDHLIRGEIVDASGNALVSPNLSHIFEVRFTTQARSATSTICPLLDGGT
jgi:hypothetical protein